ncbi:MAG: ATP-dependent DNA helicase RecG, partial [Proteobacteria bacterium]|nr:ATP-dependent DNA helicase RecG [Pseudomonadota bacterium]
MKPESMEDESFEYQSVQVLKGVGPAVAEKLKKLEIYNVQDVLFHLPLRYEDRTKLTPIGALLPGQHALIEGVIDHSEMKYTGRGRRNLLCHLSDGTGAVILRFFHFNKTQQSNLSNGQRLRCFGEVRGGGRSSGNNSARNSNKGRLEIFHPEYQLVQQADTAIEQSLTPFYPKTDGIHQTLLKKISSQVLDKVNQGHLVDWLPASVMQQYKFPDLVSALLSVHRPDKDADVRRLNQCQSKPQQRLLFEELLAHQLSLLQARQIIRKNRAAKIVLDKKVHRDFVDQLPFQLTAAQENVIAEILADIDSEQPMLRLVQGDV